MPALAMGFGTGCAARAPGGNVVTSTNLRSGVTVQGNSSLYTLTTPSEGWKQQPTGTLAKDTDLELSGNESGLWAIARVAPAGARAQSTRWSMRAGRFSPNVKTSS
jgi:hypothetical protein